MPGIIDTILSRRSIRQFTLEVVQDETLTLLLKAAMSAPTACNSQPWEFIVVTGQAVLGAIWLPSMASIYGRAVLPVAGLP